MPLYEDPAGGVRLAHEPLREWTAGLLGRLDTPADVADDVAEILVASDLRGIASHGTARLPQYVKLDRGRRRRRRPPAPRRTRAGPASRAGTARTAGAITQVGVAMDDAIERAMTLGHRRGGASTTPTTTGSPAGTRCAPRQGGLIGISADQQLARSSPRRAPGSRCSAPTRSRSRRPPAASAWSSWTWRPSTIPRGRIEVAARRGETLTAGWAIGPDGSPALDPGRRAQRVPSSPLGGAEETGGYKGYGLALVVELLTGVLAGAAFGPNIVGLFSTEAKSDLGQFHLRIDPDGDRGRRRGGRLRSAPGGAPRAADRRAAHPRCARPRALPRTARGRARRGGRDATGSSSTASTTSTCAARGALRMSRCPRPACVPPA